MMMIFFLSVAVVIIRDEVLIMLLEVLFRPVMEVLLMA
jgi:hypothetical protein